MRTRTIIRWHKKRRENSAEAIGQARSAAKSLSVTADFAADNDGSAENKQSPRFASAA